MEDGANMGSFVYANDLFKDLRKDGIAKANTLNYFGRNYVTSFKCRFLLYCHMKVYRLKSDTN